MLFSWSPLTNAQVSNDKWKNATMFTDTVPDIIGDKTYSYFLSSSNEGGISQNSDVVEVTTLNDNAVYIKAVDAKILAGTPLTLDEAASWFLDNQQKGSQIASLIGSGKGSYTQFRNLGYSSSVARQLAVLGLVRVNSSAMLLQQFESCRQILNSNSSAAIAFIAWAAPGVGSGSIGLSPADVLKAADTEAEQQQIVNWMIDKGFLQSR
ncbi:hypothetical protein CCP3SC1_510026 [Gammaproteobacteria bacterium]